MKVLKKSIGVIVVLMLAMCFLYLNASAAEIVASGTCGADGDNLTWTLDDEGLLTISGEGEMADYSGEAPWSGMSIKKVIVEKNVTHITHGAFFLCKELETVVLPDTVTSIDESAFANCVNLVSINIPDSVAYLGGNVFNSCTKLKSAVIPTGVTILENGAFYGCKSLEKVQIPDSVQYISTNAFGLCENLKNIDLPNALTRIGMDAFAGCAKLESIEVPGSVYEIGPSAFYDCSSLKEIFFLGNAPQFWDSIFQNVEATAYYPSGNSTWTSDVRQDYGGAITWKAYTLKSVKITTQPKTTYTKQGVVAKTTVKADGDGLTYQWYIKNAGGTKYSKSSVTSATYSCKMSSTSKDRYVYCIVEDQYGNSVQSNTVRLRMAATITKQPTHASAAVGSVAKTTVTAVGDGLTYTWYLKNPGATKFSKSSVTSATYSVKMSESNNGRQVYCVVKDKYGKTAQSNTVTLGLPVEITTQPKTTYTKQGVVAKTTVKADGDGLTYTWYVKNSGASKYSKSSITSATYSVKMSSTSKDRLVYCVIKDKYGNSVKSNTVLLRMAATITTQPKSVTVAKGSTAKVSLTAVGDGLTYTWYYKNAGATKFTKTTAFTGNTYSVAMNAARDGRQIYCVVTDKYGKTAKSNTVTLNMK